MISDEFRERLLAHVHHRVDRIDLRNRGQRSTRRADKVADLRRSDADYAVDRRSDFCIAKVHLGLSDRGFRGLHIGLR